MTKSIVLAAVLGLIASLGLTACYPGDSADSLRGLRPARTTSIPPSQQDMGNEDEDEDEGSSSGGGDGGYSPPG